MKGGKDVKAPNPHLGGSMEVSFEGGGYLVRSILELTVVKDI